MRIALFHNTPSGGAKRAIYEWVRRLAQDHDIDVFTLSTADHDFCDIRPLAGSHRIYEFTPRRLFSSPWGRLNQLQRWRDLQTLNRIESGIASDIDHLNYDVVFAHTCFFTFIPILIQFLKTPSVYYLHEPFGPTFTRRFRRPYQQTQPWRAGMNRLDPLIRLYGSRLGDLQMKSISKATLLLANSEFTKTQIYAAFGREARFCPLGVDYQHFHPMPEIEKDNCVLSVGELTPRKGFDFLIDSLAQIPKERRPGLRLVCNMVNYSEREYLEEMAVRQNVILEITTNLKSSEMAPQYNRARLCIYAPVLEPFGLVPLEAMACQVPVIGVREGGVQEIILHEKTGLLTDRDPGIFADAIESLMANPARILEYGRNGRDYVMRDWSWEKSVARLEEFLAACVIKQ